jgi:hypothetical protein
MNPPERFAQLNANAPTMRYEDTAPQFPWRTDSRRRNDIQNEKATRQLGGLFFKGE